MRLQELTKTFKGKEYTYAIHYDIEVPFDSDAVVVLEDGAIRSLTEGGENFLTQEAIEGLKQDLIAIYTLTEE